MLYSAALSRGTSHNNVARMGKGSRADAGSTPADPVCSGLRVGNCRGHCKVAGRTWPGVSALPEPTGST